jgi:hypothetical protein
MMDAKQKRRQLFATLAALIGNGIFGFSFMFSRMALGVASPFVMLTVRFLLAAALLSAVALWAARRGDWREADGGIHFLRFHLKGKPLAPLLALGLVQPVLYFVFESYGISQTSASFSGVMIGLAPVVGLVCMDQMMVDVTDIPEAQEGDEVILLGGGIGVDEYAEWGRLNRNESLARTGKRVPRVYMENGQITEIIEGLY